MTAIIYQATNMLNGKFYIGLTQGRLAKRRTFHIWSAVSNKYKTPFAHAIRKYGAQSFTWDVLVAFDQDERAPAEERRLIKALRPHYNATPGGEGFEPTVISPEGRARIGAANRGNKYRLGKTHTQEVRRRLRAAGLRDKAKWLQRSHLGPAACAMNVVCLDDGTTHPSARAAARAYGLCASSVIEVCNRNPRRRTAGGRVFRYEEAQP